MGDQKFLQFLRASDGTLSRWSRLHLQSLAYSSIKEGDVRQATGCKNNCRIYICCVFIVVPTPLSGIRVGKKENYLILTFLAEFILRNK
jgi:hypothetical protein